MSDDRKRILTMLAEGKITPDEAERLLAAFDRDGERSEAASAQSPAKAAPKFLRVCVDAEDRHGRGPVKVNVRVPMQLLRAGVRLSSIIPPEAREKANAAMREHGVDFDLNQLKPENLEQLIEQLGDLTVDVDQEQAKVRVFCE